jgi:xanthine/CO dehydrogenase XdhC/CoxF family maturation factor
MLEGAPGVAPGVVPPHVYAPVGLDIGAETPEEIALAIVSECAAALAGRTPASLREREGPIHERR